VLFRPGLDGRTAILIQLLLLLVLAPLCDWMPIRLWLVPTHVKHAHTRQLAHREFAAHFASSEAGRERILFFVSLGERYVEILNSFRFRASIDTNFRLPLCSTAICRSWWTSRKSKFITTRQRTDL
jgi:uncharacterized membrane protein